METEGSAPATMLTLENAVEKLLAVVHPAGTDSVSLSELAGRIFARAISAPNPLPLFDNSAMDGWAVRSSDIAGASLERPVSLRPIAVVPAGQFFGGEIGAGECARIFTGSPLPAGADAVVMQEDTRVAEKKVLTLEAVKPWENIRFAGEDVKKGAVIANRGDRVTAAMLGLLGACGVDQAEVFARPRVAIVATGSELRGPGETLRPGEIYESNRLAVATLVDQAGARAEIKPVVRDDLASTVAALSEAAEADAIITCGGVSVGEFDFVKAAIERLGGTVDFWRVAIKPGKPFLHATLLGKPLFGLPGNPVSSLVTFWLLVRPALLRMSGASEVAPPISFGELVEEISNPGDRRHFIRVKMDRNGSVLVSGPQASHRLGSMAAANGLIDVPPGANWKIGRKIPVLRLD